MNKLIKKEAETINTLHKQLEGIFHKGIEIAVEIGRMLADKKKELKHGEFGPWIKENLVFTDRTARNYMNLHENRDKVLTAGNIKEAYRMLEEPKTETVSDLPEAIMKLANILDCMKPGEIVTGFTHQSGDKWVNMINIRKLDEGYAKHELLYMYNESEGGHSVFDRRGQQIASLLGYLSKHPNIAIKETTWVYPSTIGLHI
jgi:hypothetical protein